MLATHFENEFVATYGNAADFCGILNATSTAAQSVELEASTSAGTLVVGLGTADEEIRFRVRSLDQILPGPILVGSVSSSATNAEREERAEVSVTGVVSNEGGDWVSSNCSLAASVFTCTLNSGIFSATPVCNATISGSTTGEITVTPASSTSVVVRTFTTAGAAGDRAFSLRCMGPK
jgi:hypothetical protein